MSFLTPIRATTLRLSRPAFAYTTTTSPAAALHTSIPRPGLKESDHSESSPVHIPPTNSSQPEVSSNMIQNQPDRDDLANIYEAEKHDQVKSSKEGKAKWKQEIASDSEASVGFTQLILPAF